MKIVLRPADMPHQGQWRTEVITYRLHNGYVTPIVEGRTKKWFATKDLPIIASDGWPIVEGRAYRTKREAIASLN